MCNTTKVGIVIFGVGIDIVSEIVERLKSEFTMNRNEVGSIKVGLTVVNIGG